MPPPPPSPPPPPPPQPPSPEDRLNRLEENAGFTEHSVEQLTGEMLSLSRRIQEMVDRLERLEVRVGELFASEPAIDTGEQNPGDGDDPEAP